MQEHTQSIIWKKNKNKSAQIEVVFIAGQRIQDYSYIHSCQCPFMACYKQSVHEKDILQLNPRWFET